MRRRELITSLIACAPIVSPRFIYAQQAEKLPVIGFLGVDPAMWAPWTAAFVDRLISLGWIDGKTARLEFRWAHGRPELHSQYASEFIQLGADVIVTTGAAVPAVMKFSNTIPIVFAVANDPIAAKMVKTLAKPGGNATGISLQTLDLATKRFELMREAIPNIRRLAIMADITYNQAALELDLIHRLSKKFEIETFPFGITRFDDIKSVFERIQALNIDSLYVVINELLNASRIDIVNLSEKFRIRSMYGTQNWVRSGGLLSYGPNFPDLFSRAAEMTDKILRGVQPSDIPVEQPTRFELAINMKTAHAIGFTVMNIFLARADIIIE